MNSNKSGSYVLVNSFFHFTNKDGETNKFYFDKTAFDNEINILIERLNRNRSQ